MSTAIIFSNLKFLLEAHYKSKNLKASIQKESDDKHISFIAQLGYDAIQEQKIVECLLKYEKELLK